MYVMYVMYVCNQACSTFFNPNSAGQGTADATAVAEAVLPRWAGDHALAALAALAKSNVKKTMAKS